MTSIKQITGARNKKPIELTGSVALVGNSDKLLGSGYGSDIDSRDTVFRFNLAALGKSLTTDIGKKADYFLFSANICAPLKALSRAEEMRFVQICRYSNIICYPGKTKRVTKFNRRPFEMHISPTQVNNITTRLLGPHDMLFAQNNHPRNGIKLLACLLDAGLTPDLYGFDIIDRGDNSHYFDDEIQLERPQNGSGHMPSVEYALLLALADAQLITIHD
jgi:hypothetical protein